MNDNPSFAFHTLLVNVHVSLFIQFCPGMFVPGSVCNYGDFQKIQVHLSKAACRVLTIIILL